MQTFLPYPDFPASAAVLDRQRLGKQRVETLQILRALTEPGYGWRQHPAVKMWRGHKTALAEYGIAICDEWVGRGYRDTCKGKIMLYAASADALKPTWLDDEAFHASHRSALLAKLPSWYRQFGWTEPAEIRYIWPV